MKKEKDSEFAAVVRNILCAFIAICIVAYGFSILIGYSGSGEALATIEIIGVTAFFMVGLFSRGYDTTSMKQVYVALVIAIIVGGLFALYLNAKHGEYLVQQEIKNKQEAADSVAHAQEVEQRNKDFFANLANCTLEADVVPIYSLERNNEITGSVSGEIHGSGGGSFVLGFGGMSGHVDGSISGSIGEKIQYYFYRGAYGSGYVLDSIPGVTPIFESSVEPALLTGHVRGANRFCSQVSVKPWNNYSFQLHTQPVASCRTEYYGAYYGGGSITTCGGQYYETFEEQADHTDCPNQYRLITKHGPTIDIECITFQPDAMLIVPNGTIRRQFAPN